ncbi:MAG: dipeptide epimerase, partial [Rhizobiaceae bacterium]
MTTLSVTAEDWPLARPFHFAGHGVTSLEVVNVRLTRGEAQGQGEGVVPIVFDITMAGTLAQLRGVARAVAAGQPVETACAELPPGPARNALDCALWDLAAKTTGKSIWTSAGLP